MLKSSTQKPLQLCLGIMFTCALIYVFDDDNLYSIFAPEQWRWWQLFTAHFSHYDLSHLLFNMLGLLLLVMAMPQKVKHLMAAFVVAAVFINVYLLFWGDFYYAGLSGLLYAIPGMVTIQRFHKGQPVHGSMMTALALIYALFVSPMSIGDNHHWQPATMAHVLGFMAGVTYKSAYLYVRNKPFGRWINKHLKQSTHH